MFKKVKRLLSSSLFLKILAIFIAGHLIFSFSMMYFRDYMFENHHVNRIYETAYNYSNLIIDKIGTPPDTLKASQLAQELDVVIRIKNDTLRWTSDPSAPHYRSLNLQRYHKAHHTAIGFQNGLHVKTERDKTKYVISIERKDEDFLYFDHLLLLGNILVFTIILAIMYWFLKRQLKPLQALKHGVEKIRRGEFDHVIEIKRNDELGKLVESFNTMSSDVSEMIKAREQLLLDVSHELRSPITRIKLALEFMKESNAKESITSDIKEIETMISEILETERLDSPYGKLKKEKIDITNLIEETANEFEGRKPGIKVEAKGKFEIIGDMERLKIVFRNIMDNGIKYSAQQSEPVVIKVNQIDKNIVITQKDSGVGIPEDKLKHIFEPFYRVDKSRSKETGGYGLGLHLTRKIIVAHNGEVSAQSEINKGTTFTIKFPAI